MTARPAATVIVPYPHPSQCSQTAERWLAAAGTYSTADEGNLRLTSSTALDDGTKRANSPKCHRGWGIHANGHSAFSLDAIADYPPASIPTSSGLLLDPSHRILGGQLLVLKAIVPIHKICHPPASRVRPRHGRLSDVADLNKSSSSALQWMARATLARPPRHRVLREACERSTNS